jgi:hypothetical protein
MDSRTPSKGCNPLASLDNKDDNMKLNSNLLAIFGLFSASAGASSLTPINYNFIQVGYANINEEHIDEAINAIEVNTSLLISPSTYTRFSYSYHAYEEDLVTSHTLEHTGQSSQLTLGRRLPIQSKIDIMVETGLIYEFNRQHTLDYGTGSLTENEAEDEFGYVAKAGVAIALSHHLELILDTSYVDIGEESEIEYGAEFILNLSNQLSLVLNGSMSEAAESIGLAAQFNF